MHWFVLRGSDIIMANPYFHFVFTCDIEADFFQPANYALVCIAWFRYYYG